MHQKKITIVLICHKSKKNILRFVNGLSKKHPILIIDNSNEKELKKNLGKRKHIKIFNTKNNGYGAAINFASNLVETESFFVFNPDILNVDDKFIDFFQKKAKILENNFLCLGPRFLNVNKKSHKQSNKTIKVAEIKAINGACMFINKEKFNLINGFDENFFLFFEENDFCKRGKKKGMKIYQLNDISVIHKTGSSVEYKNKKEGNKLILLRNWHFIWSKFYYIKKHYSFLIAIIYFVPIYARIIFRIFINSLQKNHFKKEKFLVRFDALNNAIKGQKSLRRI